VVDVPIFNICVDAELIAFAPIRTPPTFTRFDALAEPILILPVVIAVAIFNVPEVNAPAYDCDDVPFVPPIVKVVEFTVSIAFLRDVLIFVRDVLMSAKDTSIELLRFVTYTLRLDTLVFRVVAVDLIPEIDELISIMDDIFPNTDALRIVIDDVFDNTDKLRDVINDEFVNNEFKFVT
jgi:hypothetical protein